MPPFTGAFLCLYMSIFCLIGGIKNPLLCKKGIYLRNGKRSNYLKNNISLYLGNNQYWSSTKSSSLSTW